MPSAVASDSIRMSFRVFALPLAALSLVGVAALPFSPGVPGLSGAVAQAAVESGEWSRIAIDVFAGGTSLVVVLDTARDRLIAFSGDPGPSNLVWALPLGTSGPWVRLDVSGTPPLPRYGAAGAYDPVSDRLLVFGGSTGFSWTNDVWELRLSGTPTWAPLAPAPGAMPGPRQDAIAAYDPSGRRLVVFGGYNGGFLDDAWSLALDGPPAWSALATSGARPSPRGGAAPAFDATRGRMVIFGGWNGAAFLDDTWALDLGISTWVPISTAHKPQARREAVAVAHPAGDRMVLFGGENPTLLGDVWEMGFGGTPDWTLVPASGDAPTPRANGGAAFDPLRERMVVACGYDGFHRADVRSLGLSGAAAWTTRYQESTVPYLGSITARRDYVVALDPDHRDAILFGGTLPPGGPFDDTDEIWRLRLGLADPQWERVVVAGPSPAARHGHRSVWDPVRDRMLVFGGYAYGLANDVWAYEATPEPHWTLLPASGVPPLPRMLTGVGFDPLADRLIVVGGHNGYPSPLHPMRVPFLNDVWQLPLSGPNALTWSALTTTGTPPAPRWIYDMKWDPVRSRFVIFGGVTAGEIRKNDVWVLQMGTTPSWQELIPAGAPPSGRSDHAMVYDPPNDRMVVFGGYDGSFRNDAWALSLSGAPRWDLLTPAGGPPAGRDIVSGLYDPAGARMLIYGGFDGTSFLNDTWTLTWPGAPVPVYVSLEEVQAESHRVRIVWVVPGVTRMRARVYRLERGAGSSTPHECAAPVMAGGGRLVFEDRDVAPGRAYGYTLSIEVDGEPGFSTTLDVDVPAAFAFAIDGIRPNPTESHLTVAFTLADRSDARLELLDVAGRRVDGRPVGSLGPGPHEVRLAEGTRLEPGVYLVRLVAPGQIRTAKALVMR